VIADMRASAERNRGLMRRPVKPLLKLPPDVRRCHRADGREDVRPDRCPTSNAAQRVAQLARAGAAFDRAKLL
jgi:hypothetical protein